MQNSGRWIRATALLASLGFASQAGAQAFADVKQALVDYSKSDFTPKRTCEAVAKRKWQDVIEIKATVVVASGQTPGFCRIAGTIKPEVAFEVTLPERWNGRFYMIGNGGHAGENLEDAGRVTQRNAAMQLGFAFAQTNTGHDSRKEPGASYVLSNPAKAVDYAYRAVHVTAATAKAMIKAYYPKAASHSYWNSCSNGGRQGLMSSQRFPEDFDGVLANAPWTDHTGFTVGAVWNQRAVANVGLTPAKLATVADKVMARCDAIDGLSDGQIDDPRKCDFDPRRDVPPCAAGRNDASCLTAAQSDAIAKVYGGPQAGGRKLFHGFLPGSEAVVTGAGGTQSSWMGMIVPASPEAKPADFNLAENTLRYLMFTPPQPEYDYMKFDFDRDVKLLEPWGAVVNAKNPDLAKFNKRGGKIIMTYGWADQILQPEQGVEYYEAALQKNGERTPDFLRLFMVPGMTHCQGGNATDTFDAMTALINWVEKGKAPDFMVAARVFEGRNARTRPLCPYPQVARYKGTGSIDEAANFSCVVP
jgi:feruloyl esterase